MRSAILLTHMSDETIPLGYRWLVSGRVQGVGFRHFALIQAERLGVGGWVRNLPDGRVEIRVVGAPSSVAELKDEVRKGPPAGRVDRLEEQIVEPGPGWTHFEVKL